MHIQVDAVNINVTRVTVQTGQEIICTLKRKAINVICMETSDVQTTCFYDMHVFSTAQTLDGSWC